jgi:hypothetical protein
MKTMSVLDDRISIHYQHKKMLDYDRIEFAAGLGKLGEPGNIEFFVG